VDVISEKDSLSRYKLVIVPAMYVFAEQTAANLEQFAEQGGVVVFTARTSVKDEYNAVINQKLPGLVAKMCGVEVDEYISIPPEQGNEVQFMLPDLEERFATSALADVLEPKGAQVIAFHTQDFYANQPAATLNQFGKGKVIYLGMLGDGAYYEAITRWASALADINPLLETPAGVEVSERWKDEKRLLIVLNHVAQPQTITLNSPFTNQLNDQILAGEVAIEPLGVLILTS
jgi:beta-galactosidase